MQAGATDTLPFLFLEIMRNFFFIILCVSWLADIAALVAVAPLGEHVRWFSGLYCLGHVLMIMLVLKFPSDLTPRKSLTIIFTLGVAARLLFLPFPPANDVFRYVWEGYIQNLGFNPYVFAPTHPVLTDIARGELYPLWRQINHPEFSAAYPPFNLLLFRAMAGLSPQPLFFKTVMIAFDIGVMLVLMLIIERQGIKPSRLLIYAANPLVLIYIAGEGHLDVIQTFFLCLALYFILCKGHQFSGFLMLGLAIVSKYFAVLAWPFLVTGKNRRKSLAVLIPLVLYIPFMDAGAGIFQSLGAFAGNYHYNDSLAVLIRLLFGDQHLIATGFFLTIGLAGVYLFVRDRLRSVYLALGCLLLLLPTLHPWYLVLIAPFLVFFPSQAWLYLQVAVVFTFPVIAVEAQTGVFQEIAWLKLLEYVPFYGILVWAFLKGGCLGRDRFYASPESISVIIPALNEEDSIRQCLGSLKKRTALKEIIVADGGSLDQTRKIAVDMGARVVDSRPGRGIQIENGIKAASGNVIMILHADCIAMKGVFAKVVKILETHPDAVGGAFEMQFEPRSFETRIIAFLNNVRTVLTSVSFGDQAQFFRREALDDIGGFPSMMLMEDVELSLRLKEIGRLVFLRRGILVSARRWRDKPFPENLLMVLNLFPRYLIERRFNQGDGLNRKYYDIYYAKPGKMKPNVGHEGALE
jgi:rSAM/selenodomain-associated transferase 2